MTKSLQEFVDIAANSIAEAMHLLDKNPDEIVSLFNSDADLLLLAESEGKKENEQRLIITYLLIAQHSNHFIDLFKNPEILLKIITLDKEIGIILDNKQPEKMSKLFFTPDNMFKLAMASSDCATLVINRNPNNNYRLSILDNTHIAKLFETATISDAVLTYAAKQDDKQLTCIFVRFFRKENVDKDKFAELVKIMESNPSIKKEDILKIKNKFNITLNQPASLFGNTNQPPSFVSQFMSVIGYGKK